MIGHRCCDREDINGSNDLSGQNFDRLKQLYQDFWNETACTDYKFFDFLLKHRYADSEAQARSGKSLKDSKRTPVTEGGALQRVEISADSLDKMIIDDISWKANHGLWTNFALRVVFEAKIITYIKVGDSGHHRMAWIKEKDNGRAMMIGSSLRQAIFLLDAYTEIDLRIDQQREVLDYFRHLGRRRRFSATTVLWCCRRSPQEFVVSGVEEWGLPRVARKKKEKCKSQG